MIKQRPFHRVSSWPEAVDAATAGLRGIPGSAVAIVGSATMTNEELFLLRRLARALGTDWLDVVPRTGPADDFLVSADRNPNSNGARLLFADSPGSRLGAIREKIASGEIEAVIAWREDLLSADAGFEADLLGRLKFLLSADVLANPTADQAHVVLPVAAWVEKRGSMINATGRLQRLGKAIDPPGQARDDWEVLRDLIHALSGSNGLFLLEDVFKAIAAEVPAFTGLSLGKIGDAGIPLIQTTERIPLLEREAERRTRGIIVG